MYYLKLVVLKRKNTLVNERFRHPITKYFRSVNKTLSVLDISGINDIVQNITDISFGGSIPFIFANNLGGIYDEKNLVKIDVDSVFDQLFLLLSSNIVQVIYIYYLYIKYTM